MTLPESLPIFELLVQESEELPQLCVGGHYRNLNCGEAMDNVQFNIIPLDDAPRGHTGMHTHTHAEQLFRLCVKTTITLLCT